MKKNKIDEEYRFKYEKLKIHMTYWIFILLILSVVMFTLRGHDSKSLSSEIAFGATLSGIILSVIAIIMTIIGESKSENTKDTLVNLSTELEQIVENIKNATEKLGNVSEFGEGIQRIEKKMDEGVTKLYSNKTNYVEDKSVLAIDYIEIYKLYVPTDNAKMEMYILASMYYTILCMEKNELDKLNEIKTIMNEYDTNHHESFIYVSMGCTLVFTPIIRNVTSNNKFNQYIKSEIKNKHINLKEVIDKQML